MSKKIVLGLDLGPTSIGWALVEETHGRILAAGVRIFPEGVERDKGVEIPKNQQRRQARAIRRQIARRARRKRKLRDALVVCGLLPCVANLPASDPARIAWEADCFKKADPYSLRKKGLTEKLDLHDLGRVFLHLAQRRGFLSNRKADKAKKAEESKTLEEINQLAAKIKESGNRTLGAYLQERKERNSLDRVRGCHTHRGMYLQEFDAIWETQARFYPDLLTEQLKYGETGRSESPRAPIPCRATPENQLRTFGIHGMVFFHRPMYWPKSAVGKCELDPKDKRCPRADRLAQEFRVLQEVNNLRLIDTDGEIRALSEDQREIVLKLLRRKEAATFDELRKTLGLLSGDGFNLEIGDRKKLQGMATDAKLASKKYFGKEWWDKPEEEKDRIVRTLLEIKDGEEGEFLKKAVGDWKIDKGLAEKLLTVALPEGYVSYGRIALEKLVPLLRKGLPLLTRDDTPCAIRLAGYLAPWEKAGPQGNVLPAPPPITNPIVRQALHEVRNLVNAVVREYGKPDAIHIELAREVKGNAEQRAKRTLENRLRERDRAKAAAAIEESGEVPTRRKVDRYLLWREQQETCIYSGRHISLTQLLGGEIDFDHILPYSKSLDDSLMNRVVCFRSENANKGQRTVHQWLAETEPEKYAQVLQRAAKLPMEVRNRKRLKFSQKTCELEQFINRQLTDTSYITSAVVGYLKQLGTDVLGSKGQLTAELRHQWGLNGILRDDGLNLKNREDHRHHAVDALVIALTNRRRLQELARNRGTESLAEPWEGFRSDVERVINGILVSHKAQRKIRGALHDDTLYGLTQKRSGGAKTGRPWAQDWIEEEGVYVLRKPLESLSFNEVAKIRDERVRELVEARLAEFGLKSGRATKKDGGEEALASKGIPKEVWRQPLILKGKKSTSAGTVIKKVRLVKKEDSIKKLAMKNGTIKFVKPANLHHVAIFELMDPKGKSKREAHFVSMLDASNRARRQEPILRKQLPEKPDAKFLLSLSQGEMILGSVSKLPFAQLDEFVIFMAT